MTQQKMQAFVSAEDTIRLTEGWRRQLKQFEGQEDKIRFLGEERDRYRSETHRLQIQNDNQFELIQKIEREKDELEGESNLTRGLLDKRRVEDEGDFAPTVEKIKRFSIKRVLALTAILAPYALIGSYVVSLYI